MKERVQRSLRRRAYNKVKIGEEAESTWASEVNQSYVSSELDFKGLRRPISSITRCVCLRQRNVPAK